MSDGKSTCKKRKSQLFRKIDFADIKNDFFMKFLESREKDRSAFTLFWYFVNYIYTVQRFPITVGTPNKGREILLHVRII